MNILIIGSGGREHALAAALAKSASKPYLYCSPGNPGIFELAENAGLNIKDFRQIVDFCKLKIIDFVIIGPEQPLAEGLADILRADGISVFGPGRDAARLESSKKFAKEFMVRHNIPTAAYASFHSDELGEALRFIESMNVPIVLKADGLAAGKGVSILGTKEEAAAELKEFFSGKFDSAGKTVVIEEFMEGEEASILAVSDGNDFVLLASSQDHKRIYDGDQGPNTGGMGAYAPAPIVTNELLEKVKDRIIRPAIDGMKNDGTPFIGCLYAGLMIKDGQPRVVEFNVRFGDPETQPVLSVFEGDFAELIFSAAGGKINKSAMINAASRCSCCVILASEGYPASFEKGFAISGIEKAVSKDVMVYHAGTAVKDGSLVTNGGRVLAVTAFADDLKSAVNLSYEAVGIINFQNKYYRRDIGQKGINKINQ